MIRFLSLLLLGALMVVPALPAAAASFDCRKARSADERAVCGDARLSELDTRMGALWFSYARMPFLMGASGARHDEAQAFFDARKACGARRDCLIGIYDQRIAALEAGIGQALTALGRQANGADPAAPALPEPVQAIIAGYDAQCAQLGGRLARDAGRPHILTGDLDGDGRPDYLLDSAPVRCDAAATAFCGNGGCRIDLALSGQGYDPPATILGGQPTLSQGAERLEVLVWVGKEACATAPGEGQACWTRLSWQDGRLARRSSAGPQLP